MLQHLPGVESELPRPLEPLVPQVLRKLLPAPRAECDATQGRPAGKQLGGGAFAEVARLGEQGVVAAGVEVEIWSPGGFLIGVWMPVPAKQ